MKRVALALLGLLLSGFVYGDQILVNGNLESGSVSPWTNDTQFETGTGWLITSSGCNSGTYCVIDTGNVGLMQTFAGVATTTITHVSFYEKTFLVAAVVDFFYQGGARDEFVVPPTSDAGGGWQFFDATSDLRASGTLVGFEVWGNASTIPTQLDDLSIATTSIPEPETLVLFGSGLFGLFGITWIRRTRA